MGGWVDGWMGGWVGVEGGVEREGLGTICCWCDCFCFFWGVGGGDLGNHFLLNPITNSANIRINLYMYMLMHVKHVILNPLDLVAGQCYNEYNKYSLYN